MQINSFSSKQISKSQKQQIFLPTVIELNFSAEQQKINFFPIFFQKSSFPMQMNIFSSEQISKSRKQQIFCSAATTLIFPQNNIKSKSVPIFFNTLLSLHIQNFLITKNHICSLNLILTYFFSPPIALLHVIPSNSPCSAFTTQ